MGIEVKHGSGKAAMSYANLVKKGAQVQAQQAQTDQALRWAMSVQAKQAQVDMAQFAMEQKALADKNKLAFEFQKFQVAEQNDFLKSEQIRMDRLQAVEDKRRFAEDQKFMAEGKKKSEYDIRIKAIDETDTLSDSEKDRAKFNEYNKFHGGATRIGVADEETETMTQVQQASEERAQGRYEMTAQRHEAFMQNISTARSDKARKQMIEDERLRMSQERHELTLRGEEPSEMEAGRYQMAQERHAKAMQPTPSKGSSFAQKKSAQEFLEEKKRGLVAQFLGWDAYSEEDQLMANEAQAVLRNQPTAVPPMTQAPKSLGEMSNTVKQLNTVDPEKAQAYYNRYIGLFRGE